MAVRDDFAAGEVLAAADLNDTFASKWNAKTADTAPSTPAEGDAWVDTTGSTTIPKIWNGSAWQVIGGGKILQIVRATDSTSRSTTSTTFTDVTGMTVTISPTKSDSAVIVAALFYGQTQMASTVSKNVAHYQITDSSNNAISGAQDFGIGSENVAQNNSFYYVPVHIWAYATPATTSAVTYKLRFKANAANMVAYTSNQASTGQMYAIEVAA